MSEKIKGIRAYWSGEKFISQNGNAIKVPEHFYQKFPSKIPFDGVLSLGNEYKQNFRDYWPMVQFIITDLPNSKSPYEVRLEQLEKLYLPPKSRLIDVQQCNGSDHLDQFLDKIVKSGGDAVMLIKPQSYYIPGISSGSLFTLRVFFKSCQL